MFSDRTVSKVKGFVTVSTGRDLAVLRIDPPGKKFSPLVISSDPPSIGEKVLAFGSPRSLRGSVSDGIVSAVRNGGEVRDILKDSVGQDIYTEVLGYDLDATWTVTEGSFASKSVNSWLLGETLTGTVVRTIADGRVVHAA